MFRSPFEIITYTYIEYNDIYITVYCFHVTAFEKTNPAANACALTAYDY